MTGIITGIEHVMMMTEAQTTGVIQTHYIAMAEGIYIKEEIHIPRNVDKPIHFMEKRQIE